MSLHRVQSMASVLPQELLAVVVQVCGINVNSTGRWQQYPKSSVYLPVLMLEQHLGLSPLLPPLPMIRKMARKGAAGSNISWSSREAVLEERGKWGWKEIMV